MGKQEAMSAMAANEQSLQNPGVTPQQFRVLRQIARSSGKDGVALTQLAKSMRLTNNRVTRLLAVMERNKLVRWSAGNGRTQPRVFLSTKGIALADRLGRSERAELCVSKMKLNRTRGSVSALVPSRITLASPPCSMPEIED